MLGHMNSAFVFARLYLGIDSDWAIDLTVYPGVHHAFDVAQLKPGRGPNGRWLEYEEPAARDAEKKTRAFLADHLVSMPAAPR